MFINFINLNKQKYEKNNLVIGAGNTPGVHLLPER